MKRYTEPQRAEILRQVAITRASGRSFQAIAEQLNVALTTIRCFIRDYPLEWKAAYAAAVALIGEVPHQRYSEVKTKSIDAAGRMQAEGKSLDEIAASFGVSVQTIETWRAKHRQRWDTAYLSACQPFAPPPAPPVVSATGNPARTLWSLAEMMFGRKANIRSDKTVRHYRYSINAFAKHLGRVPTEADLSDDSLIAWLADMQRGESAVSTARSYVERIRCLWRFLNDRGEITTRPTFDLPPIPEPQPIALDAAQLRQLFEAAMCRPGFVAGIPARYYWPALFGFAFCTSERRGATLALRWEWINLETRAVSIPAIVRKGGLKNATYRLWDEAAFLLRRILAPKRELVFPWPYSEGVFYSRLGKIFLDAGMPDDRRHKLHVLRVTHNSWHKAMTGQHSPLLMHADTTTSERHYEDKRMTVREPVKLPTPWATDKGAAVVAVNVSRSEARKLPRARALAGGGA